MRRCSIMLLLVAAACAPAPPASTQGSPAELAGRFAGPPQRCVLIDRGGGLRVAERNPSVLLYAQGATIWANHLAPGCKFSWRDILIFEPVGSQFCRGDLVRSIDSLSHLPGPACALGDFVPYTN